MRTKRTETEKVFLYSQLTLYEKKLEQMEEVENKVAWLLKHYAHLRDCDKCLIRYYHVQVDGWTGDLTKEIIHSMTPEESITRARRKIQELARKEPEKLWYFLPSEEVTDARLINEGAVASWAKGHTI